MIALCNSYLKASSYIEGDIMLVIKMSSYTIKILSSFIFLLEQYSVEVDATLLCPNHLYVR